MMNEWIISSSILIAVILIGTLVVGCSFAGAPETVEPVIRPTAPAESTEPTGHAPDDDMSNHEEDLPIPEVPGALGILDGDGLLVFPGTEWNMSLEEVVEALDIREYGRLSGMYGFVVPEMTVFGYPAKVVFYFDRYNKDTAWGLSNVWVAFADGDVANGVREQLFRELGPADFSGSGVVSETWHSDVRIADLISPEAYAEYEKTSDIDMITGEWMGDAASSIHWYGEGIADQENRVVFSSGLAVAKQIEAVLAND